MGLWTICSWQQETAPTDKQVHTSTGGGSTGGGSTGRVGVWIGTCAGREGGSLKGV